MPQSNTQSYINGGANVRARASDLASSPEQRSNAAARFASRWDCSGDVAQRAAAALVTESAVLGEFDPAVLAFKTDEERAAAREKDRGRRDKKTRRTLIGLLRVVEGWARVVAHFVKPGGRFYFLDQHPVVLSFDYHASAPHPPIYDFFHKPDPIAFDDTSVYSDPDATVKTVRSYEWIHPVGDVVTSLIDAGLQIEYLHEFDTVSWKALAFMELCDDGLYRLPEGMPRLPMSYSISARKPL